MYVMRSSSKQDEQQVIPDDVFKDLTEESYQDKNQGHFSRR